MHLAHILKTKSYEELQLVLRTDRIIFVGYAALFVVMLALPAGVYLLLTAFLPEVLEHSVGFPAVILTGSLYLLSVWLFFFTEFVDYYLDVWLVTNDRIVNVEQQGLFARTVSELDLWKIQDVTSEVKGMLATIFNYGNVYIQTAGQQERFIFRNIPDPHGVRKRITDLIADDRKYHPAP